MLRLLLILVVTSLTLAVPHEKLVEKRKMSDPPQYHVIKGPMDWYEAKVACLAQGWQLAQPRNQAQMDAMMALYVAGFYWIGVSDEGHEGNFTYCSDNKEITYSNWDDNEPNNELGDENCVEVWKLAGKWNDVNCTVVRADAFCEDHGPHCEPHMRTFDERTYNFQGIGWYYLFKDCTDNPRFEVTTKFEPREDSKPDQIKTRTIAINVTVGNQYAIIDGRDVTTGRTGGQVNDAKVITVQEDEKDIKLHFTSKDTTFFLKWTLRKHTLDVSYSGSFYSGKLCGLMGNADDDPRNDFQKPDGSITKNAIEFGESWKVTNKK
ncbi:alpha-tectorin-like isoform X2 [Saccoglossus kowalevskii]|uniref:Zonadhesin-like isoform X1 n=1 Tax=Saccoglossus kowalevskii TaxID=10224 RepID=A0ABM0MSN5_SACKO|nr:PREDICTED: zonadhesin-like isoform X1 [Saccoglossus kowalevskii]XP_006823026.1 PREDICTED: zonadhesin-like isoform X2 [Saccoglossus kowalevskii]